MMNDLQTHLCSALESALGRREWNTAIDILRILRSYSAVDTRIPTSLHDLLVNAEEAIVKGMRFAREMDGAFSAA